MNCKSLLLVSQELNISTIITQKNCFITIAEHVCNDALKLSTFWLLIIRVEDQYCPVMIAMTKRLSHVDTSLKSYSVWSIHLSCSPNIFPALALQSVSKCLKVFSGILVAERFSVYVFQRLSVCMLIINLMFGL